MSPRPQAKLSKVLTDFLSSLFANSFFLSSPVQVVRKTLLEENPDQTPHFPLQPRRASDQTEQLTQQTIPSAELPLYPPALSWTNTSLGAFGGRKCRQGFYRPLSRPAPTLQEPDYLAYATVPCCLGALAGDHRLVYSRDSIQSQLGLGLLSQYCTLRSYPSGDSGSWRWPSTESWQGGQRNTSTRSLLQLRRAWHTVHFQLRLGKFLGT